MYNIWLQLLVFTVLLWLTYEVWKKMMLRIWELHEGYRQLNAIKKEIEKLIDKKVELKWRREDEE